jgi:hypothetical protein
MSATRTRANGSKPESASKPAPESAPALDIAGAVESEQVAQSVRVYVDVPGVPRVPTADGTLACVQREKRADGTLGEYLLAEIRKQRTGTESAQRYSLARIQALKSALDSQDITTLH